MCVEFGERNIFLREGVQTLRPDTEDVQEQLVLLVHPTFLGGSQDPQGRSGPVISECPTVSSSPRTARKGVGDPKCPILRLWVSLCHREGLGSRSLTDQCRRRRRGRRSGGGKPVECGRRP